MALLEIDTELKTAELYFREIGEAWHIECKYDRDTNGQETGPAKFSTVGPQGALEFTKIDELIAAADLPELAKWAARGLIGIPLNGGGK